MSTSGISTGSFDPSKAWQNLKSDTDPVISGGQQEAAQKTSVQVGSQMNILLATPDEMVNIPLFIKAGPMNFERSAPEHPVLTAAFEKFRDVTGGKVGANPEMFIAYETLFNALSKNLQDKLNAEMQKPIEQRDPDIQALALTLAFGASILSIVSSFSRGIEEKSSIHKVAEEYRSLPNLAGNAALTFMASVLTAYEEHAATLGPNNSQFNALMGIMNELKGHIKAFK